jgi:hypothetical protein
MNDDIRLILCCALLGRSTWRTATRGGHPLEVFVPFFVGIAVGYSLFH